MSPSPQSRRTQAVPFPSTRWSVVVACARPGGDPAAAQAALTQLCRDYWPPLYAFVRRRGFRAPDAQDLVQGFFAHLLATDAPASVDRARGKFRSFLLASLNHYLSNDRDRRHAAKRGEGQPPLWLEGELAAVEAAWLQNTPGQTALTEVSAFEQAWAFAVVERALAALGAAFADGGRRERVFAELRPFLTGGPVVPERAALAARLGTSEEVLRSDLSRLRTRYRACLRAEVERTVPADADIEEEIRYLCRVLLAAG